MTSYMTDNNDDHPVIPGMTVKVRRWIYGISIPAQPLLVAYGVLSEQKATLWAAMVLAIISSGVALPNVSGD